MTWAAHFYLASQQRFAEHLLCVRQNASYANVIAISNPHKTLEGGAFIPVTKIKLRLRKDEECFP